MPRLHSESSGCHPRPRSHDTRPPRQGAEFNPQPGRRGCQWSREDAEADDRDGVATEVARARAAGGGSWRRQQQRRRMTNRRLNHRRRSDARESWAEGAATLKRKQRKQVSEIECSRKERCAVWQKRSAFSRVQRAAGWPQSATETMRGANRASGAGAHHAAGAVGARSSWRRRARRRGGAANSAT